MAVREASGRPASDDTDVRAGGGAAADTQRQYGRLALEAILGDELEGFMGVNMREQGVPLVRIDDHGLWISPKIRRGLAWTYLCDLDGLDPLERPALPIPFTPAELAAFMLDGVGYFVQQRFGRWSDGPDQAALDSLGEQGNHPQAAVEAAYASYRAAEAEVGPLDDHHLTAEGLNERFASERLMGETDQQYELRTGWLRRLQESLPNRLAKKERIRRKLASRLEPRHGETDQQRGLRTKQTKLRLEKLQAQKQWRQKMVRALLLPTLSAPTALDVSAEADAPGATKLPRVQVMEQNRQIVLQALRAAGFDPLALPPVPPGRSCPAKAVARSRASLSRATFDRAWKELSKDGQLRRT